MRFSAKGEYGILALIELAIQNGHGTIQARIVSQNQRIPPRFLEQVLNTLKKSGFVESVRGAQGGYTLARSPEEIRIGNVLEALEGPIAPTHCGPGGIDPCWHEIELGYCSIKEVRETTRSSFLKTLNAITLQDLCNRKREKERNKALTYHI